MAEEDGLELYYQEYSIESGDDWESAVDEFRSESKETYWFDLKIVNPVTFEFSLKKINLKTKITMLMLRFVSFMFYGFFHFAFLKKQKS